MERYEFCSPCLIGVESIAAGEFRRLGLEDVRCEDGRVFFRGGMDAMARANINSRYTERVMIRLASFPCENFDQLFDGAKAVPWEEFIMPGAQFPVKGRSIRSRLESLPAIQRTIKKAAAERLMKARGVKWVEEKGIRQKIRFIILKDVADIFLDTSGPSLHKRGYRPEGGVAPLRETLAASMVDLSRFRGDMTLLDPFCGSGTIPIEAALKAARRAPGIERRFDAEDFSYIPSSVWALARDEARAAITKTPATVIARDIDPACVELARANARRAGVEDIIRFERADAAKTYLNDFQGVIVTNPPYGERIGDKESARALYRAFGGMIGPMDGKNIYVLSPDDQFERMFGKKASRKRWLYNGMIKCSLYMYFQKR